MGDRDKGAPTIELIEIRVLSPKHSHGLEICSRVCQISVDTRSDLRREFHRYSLEPRALPPVHILVAVLFLLLASMQKRHLQNHNSNVPVLRKKEPGKKLSRLPVGESVRIIEGSS